MDLYDVLKNYAMKTKENPLHNGFLGFVVLCTKKNFTEFINTYNPKISGPYALIEILGIRFKIASCGWTSGSEDRVHICKAGSSEDYVAEGAYIIHGKSN